MLKKESDVKTTSPSSSNVGTSPTVSLPNVAPVDQNPISSQNVIFTTQNCGVNEANNDGAAVTAIATTNIETVTTDSNIFNNLQPVTTGQNVILTENVSWTQNVGIRANDVTTLSSLRPTVAPTIVSSPIYYPGLITNPQMAPSASVTRVRASSLPRSNVISAFPSLMVPSTTVSDFITPFHNVNPTTVPLTVFNQVTQPTMAQPSQTDTQAQQECLRHFESLLRQRDSYIQSMSDQMQAERQWMHQQMMAWSQYFNQPSWGSAPPQTPATCSGFNSTTFAQPTQSGRITVPQRACINAGTNIRDFMGNSTEDLGNCVPDITTPLHQWAEKIEIALAWKHHVPPYNPICTGQIMAEITKQLPASILASIPKTSLEDVLTYLKQQEAPDRSLEEVLLKADYLSQKPSVTFWKVVKGLKAVQNFLTDDQAKRMVWGIMHRKLPVTIVELSGTALPDYYPNERQFQMLDRLWNNRRMNSSADNVLASISSTNSSNVARRRRLSRPREVSTYARVAASTPAFPVVPQPRQRNSRNFTKPQIVPRAREESPEKKRTGVCWYHRRFGDEAAKCCLPCKYKLGTGPTNPPKGQPNRLKSGFKPKTYAIARASSESLSSDSENPNDFRVPGSH